MEHSENYEYLLNQYRLGYMKKSTLKGYVRLYGKMPAKGITEEEYLEITGEKYEG